jgi:aryl-alcohol dehydrogenase-like predicted oxidoreductase/enamine deaminase RidA (YjgF/YER057c/UK114 family)
VTGLWQVADLERGGRKLDPDAAAAELAAYVRAGFDTFDMADHYGSAEEIVGRLNVLAAAGGLDLPVGARPVVCTKWCPAPGRMDAATVRAGVEERLRRLNVDRVDLLQFHWWTYEHPGYVDAMREIARIAEEGRIGAIGVTNFDTDHLRLLVRLGVPVASNQVVFSLLDRRAAEDMTAFCLESGVKLIAYGTLAGGLLDGKWLGRREPAPGDIADWSKMKYKRFVDAIGGWDTLQRILAALAPIAEKHGVTIANVAARYVLDQPAVAAIIVGARLGESEHRNDNLAVFSFALDEEDRASIAAALSATLRIPGDCGDEYRRPPFLTASGDLSHHLASLPKVYESMPVEGRADRFRIDSGSVWEPVCGFSRAVRNGKRILVSGTTATHRSGETICAGDAAAQTVYALDKIAAAIRSLGGALEDVVRTRIYMRDASRWEEVARVHGRYFGAIRPANTLIGVADLVGPGYEVEIEAEAELG